MVGVARIFFVSTLAVTCGLSLFKEVGAIDYDYTGVVTRVTPFDSRYRRIERYLESREPSHHPNPVESRGSDLAGHLKLLRKYLKIAGRFEYTPDGNGREDTAYGLPSHSEEKKRFSNDSWQLPEETEERGAGDCEDKAIWLYARLIQIGFESVRLVVGRYRADQTTFHAWVVYYFTGKIFILDPTINDGLWEARHYPEGFYKPIYSYSKDGRWHHEEGYRQLVRQAYKQRPG